MLKVRKNWKIKNLNIVNKYKAASFGAAFKLKEGGHKWNKRYQMQFQMH